MPPEKGRIWTFVLCVAEGNCRDGVRRIIRQPDGPQLARVADLAEGRPGWRRYERKSIVRHQP